ncbi:GNAT family N-acetyltransferase [Nocardioides panacisoli]|uniref:GNAT family N-acetyltransferase n=1 Tax=Nocardioides panacisoli TaxID=627624 RepID=A0ABP7I0X8_9ACTN
MVGTTVAPAATADAGRVVRTLADAFADDPVLAWLLPSGRRAGRLTAHFRATVGGDVLGDGLSKVSPYGAVLVHPDGWRQSLLHQAGHAASYVRAFGHRLPWAVGVQAALERRHPREPHRYLSYIGVAAAGRGRGVGSALLAAVTAESDAAGLPTYLEASSPRNARLYRRHGFVTVDVVRPLGSPPLELMMRVVGG